jgi:hypothetical protein
VGEFALIYDKVPQVYVITGTAGGNRSSYPIPSEFVAQALSVMAQQIAEEALKAMETEANLRLIEARTAARDTEVQINQLLADDPQ